MSRLLSTVGIVISVAYLAALAWLVSGRLTSLIQMPLNEVGDFLAGAFGPLAILWLILGFFQQGIELRQNTRALDMQAAELRNSVEQQRQLVEVSREQMKAELEVVQFERKRAQAAARPKFVIEGAGAAFSDGRATYSSSIKNVGNAATQVHLSVSIPTTRWSLPHLPSWMHGETRVIEYSFETRSLEQPAVLRIDFIDASLSPGTVAFSMKPVHSQPVNMIEFQEIDA